MTECPCCHGERGFDFSATEAPLQRLASLFGITYVPQGFTLCNVCEGAGEVTDELRRDYQAWAVARVDQLLAAVDAGDVSVP